MKRLGFIVLMVVLASTAFALDINFVGMGTFSTNGENYAHFQTRSASSGAADYGWEVEIYQNGVEIPYVKTSMTNASVNCGAYGCLWSAGLFIYTRDIHENGPFTVIIWSRLDREKTYYFQVTGRHSAEKTVQVEENEALPETF